MMKVALLTIIVSPHQLPLSREIVRRIGADNFCYAYVAAHDYEREGMGWGEGTPLPWCHPARECREFLENADLLYCGERDLELMEHRLKNHAFTCYSSERWFKPIGESVNVPLFRFNFHLRLPGWFRLLVPSYFRMARRFIRFFDSPDFRYLAIGRWAERDMRLIYRIFHPLTPMRRIYDKIVPWGYFVAPSAEKKTGAENRLTAGGSFSSQSTDRPIGRSSDTLRILWVGRMLGWKRVDTIIRAVARANRERKEMGQENRLTADGLSLTIVGDGPEKGRLKRLAQKCLNKECCFHPSVPIAEIRRLMRRHDVYVLASNGQEGWGAALNEAMEEGMRVLGTCEAGSSSCMLPETNLFHAGDWRRLAELLQGDIPSVGIGKWSAAAAAERLLNMFKEDGRDVL